MAKRKTSSATVAFARIGWAHDQPPLGDPVAALMESLEPGTTVHRYDRTWRMAAYTQENGFVSGEIGFERPGAIVPLWNESTKRFVPAATRDGATSPFVIDLAAFRVAFQLRGSIIKPGTFRGNFQALLNTARPYDWRVRLEGVHQLPWEDWLDAVDRITKIYITARAPNPRFPGKHLEDFFTRTKAAAVNIGLAASEGDSLDLDDDELVSQAIELAKEHGNIRAEGERVVEQGVAKVPPFNAQAEGQARQEKVPADPATKEADRRAMREALSPDSDDAGDQL